MSNASCSTEISPMAAGADAEHRCIVQGCSCHFVSGMMCAEDRNESKSETDLGLSQERRG